MSMESAVAFYERMEGDQEALAQIKELGTVDKIEAYVKGGLGYEFTWEEMQKVVFERHPELTDEELEAVVGGMSTEETLWVAYGGFVAFGAGATILTAANALIIASAAA